jgi:alcohol dehydrogenase class IV
MGIDTTNMTELEAAKACVLGIEKLRDDLQLPNNFKDYGMTATEEDLEKIADTAEYKNRVGASAGSAPRQGTREDYKRIALDAYNGVKIKF